MTIIPFIGRNPAQQESSPKKLGVICSFHASGLYTGDAQMGDHRLARFFVLLLVSFAGHLCAQELAPWHDPSPHSVQFVTADDNVELEVLDWGGSGRPLVLLAGLGNTAHVFDDFAPKPTSSTSASRLHCPT